MKLELIIITKISLLDSLWKGDWGELGNGLFSWVDVAIFIIVAIYTGYYGEQIEAFQFTILARKMRKNARKKW